MLDLQVDKFVVSNPEVVSILLSKLTMKTHLVHNVIANDENALK